MSTEAPTLPAGWSNILDEVNARIAAAVALADARLEAMPPLAADALVEERRQDYTALCERLQRLSGYLESAEQIVQSVDEILATEESHIQQQLARCETLRQKTG